LNFLLTLSLFLLTLSLVINGKERKKEEGSKITKNWTLLQEICKKFGKRRLYEKIKLTTKNLYQIWQKRDNKRSWTTLLLGNCMKRRDWHPYGVLVARLQKKKDYENLSPPIYMITKMQPYMIWYNTEK